MKRRSTFVGNSSSSSFMIGLGKINDIVKFKEYLKDHGLDMDDDKNHDGEYGIENIKEYDDKYRLKTVDGRKVFEVSSFMADVNYVIKPGDEWLVWIDAAENEGDSSFWNDATGEMDYWRADLDYFESDSYYDKAMIIYKALNASDSGIDMESVSTQYGAGRNG